MKLLWKDLISNPIDLAFTTCRLEASELSTIGIVTFDVFMAIKTYVLQLFSTFSESDYSGIVECTESIIRLP